MRTPLEKSHFSTLMGYPPKQAATFPSICIFGLFSKLNSFIHSKSVNANMKSLLVACYAALQLTMLVGSSVSSSPRLFLQFGCNSLSC